jgi:hypothetical protein
MGEDAKLPAVVERKRVAAAVTPRASDSLSEGVRIANERLAEAASPEEAILATRIRGEIIRQNLEVEKQQLKISQFKDRIAFKRRQQILDAGLRFSALAVGGTLVVLGYGWLGGFVMASGLYTIAKDFIVQKFPSPVSGSKGQDDE